MPKHPLEKLLQEHCPQGVEFVAIKEICKIGRGRVISQKYIREHKGDYPVYSSQTKDSGILGYIDTYDFDGELVTWTTDGVYAGTCFYRCGKFNCTNVCGTLKVIDTNKILPKFLAYILNLHTRPHVTKASNPKLMNNVMADIKIPLPPLIVQEKIVTILNTFTELSAELSARKKQYSYYLNALLDFGEPPIRKHPSTKGGLNPPLSPLEHTGLEVTHALLKQSFRVEWVELGEVGEFVRGSGLTKADLYPDNPNAELVGAIHYGEIHTFYNTRTTKTKSSISPKDVILTTTSEDLAGLCKAVAWLGDSPIVTGGHAAIFKHSQNPTFIAYWFQTANFTEQKRKIAYGAKVTEIKPKELAHCLIPLPPLPIQAQIVEILDQFHTLSSDLQEGIPAEIALRKKQYQYYLNALLDFKPM